MRDFAAGRGIGLRHGATADDHDSELHDADHDDTDHDDTDPNHADYHDPGSNAACDSFRLALSAW